jgi:hypothetical protein
MSELVTARHRILDQGGSAARKARGRLALELVAMRGKDVVGVRHLRDGATAWVGDVAETLARVPMREIGDRPFLLGEVRAGTYTVQVPPRARARVHGADGIPRLVVGPHRVELSEGERAVVVLGPVQVRAQVVPFEAPAGRFNAVAAWVAVLGVIYVAAIALTTAMVRPSATKLEPGAMHRIHERFLEAPRPAARMP